MTASCTRRCVNAARCLLPGASLLLILCSATAPVRADEQRYSLGTIQEDTDLVVPAGKSVVTRIGFYNIDGTVPATVELSADGIPQGWDVTFSRVSPLDTDVVVDSATQLSLEVAPREVSPERATCNADSQESRYLQGRGYVCADMVYVLLTVPEDVPSSEGQTVRMEAAVTWPSASAQLRQEREFVFQVEVRSPARSDVPWWSVAPSVVLIMVLLYFVRRHLVKSGNL